MGSRKPKFTGTCSHCGIVGHMARDCYKRQQETTSTVKQNTVSCTDDPSASPNLTQKPDLIQFQQFPTFVKRKLECSSTNEDSDEEKSDDEDLTPEQKSMLSNLCKATDKWEAAIAMQPEAAQSWGLRTNPNKIIKLLPISAHEETNHRTILLHQPTPYEPPFYNNFTIRQPDITTPTALIWHPRLGCACKEVMMRTQKNVIGMRVQNESWKTLDTQLPCSSCVAGKMRKLNASRAASYSDLKTLTTTILASQNPARHFGFAVSRTPATTAQSNERNKVV